MRKTIRRALLEFNAKLLQADPSLVLVLTQSHFSQVEEQRQSQRNPDQQIANYRSPKMLHAQSAAFKVNEDPKTDRGYDDIHREIATDRICKKLIEEETKVQAVLTQKLHEK